MSAAPSTQTQPVAPSALSAWLYLVRLSWRRQARVRVMVAVSVALLLITTNAVIVQTFSTGWGLQNARAWWRGSPLTYQDVVVRTEAMTATAGAFGSPPLSGLGSALTASVGAVLQRTDFVLFSDCIFLLFVSILLPLWSLSFGTQALGGDREGNNLLWLLTRPLSRAAIYMAKFVALLPWTLALNIGGFILLCVCAGRPGLQALKLFWPAVLCGSLAFAALFHLIGAYFRWPTIIALVYAFFLEIIMGNMPGYFKRVSISFYTRCMMYDAAGNYGVQPESPMIFLPVSGTTAMVVLLSATVGLLLLGMYLFSRTEYVTAE